MFLGFHLRHAEQIGEQIEVMPFGQPSKRRQGLRNHRHGLVRAAIGYQLVDP